MRVRWWHVGLVVALAVVVVLGFAAAWLVRKPAPAPAGMVARLEAEQRAFIESVWPEGEAAWPLLERALAAEGEERIELVIEASERARLYESLDALPAGAGDPVGLSVLQPYALLELRALRETLMHATRAAFLDEDRALASAGLRALFELDSYFLQHPGFVAAVMAPRRASHTFGLVAGAILRADASEELCWSLIEQIDDADIAARALAAPNMQGQRLDTQRAVLFHREFARDSSVGDRIRVRLTDAGTSPPTMRENAAAAVIQEEYAWLRWCLRYDALEMERLIDAYFDAVESWWAMPMRKRAAEPTYPGDTRTAPWVAVPTMWSNSRAAIDFLTMKEAGVILLLRIEAYHARTGKWPAALEDAAPAEEIIDPVTGRAFVYELVGDSAPGDWPFVLRAPLTVEEYSRLMVLGEDSRPVEALWREAVTITKEGEEE